MGYRSDVAFTLTIDSYNSEDVGMRNKFKYVVGMFKLTDFYRVITSPSYDCINGKELGWSWRDGSITFCVTGWKWYDGYESVEAYEQMWKAMQNIDGVSGYFMRSGEEMDDNVTDDFGEHPDWDLAYISKVFDFQRGDYLGVTESEEGTDEQVQTDTHPCGQDADQERQDANTAAVG